jgi:hypothetical protein
MNARLPLFALLAALLVAPAASAQPDRSGAVRGRVTSAETGEPLPGAHVFFSTTMTGTATDTAGRFVFPQGAPVGTQRLHASMVGYETRTLDTLLQDGQPYRLHLALEPEVIEGEDVSVAGRASDEWTTQGEDDWTDRLEKFERLFVGTSPRAEATTLANPEALAFDASWWGKLKADAAAPLVFENRALGYRLRYHLREFEGSRTKVRWDGEPHFEALTPSDSAEVARWRAKRQRAFRGSLRHLLLALLGDSLDRSGFRVRRVPASSAFGSSRARQGRAGFPVSAGDLLERPPPAARDTLPAGTRWLDFRGRLRVTYTRESETRAFLRWQRDRRAPRDYQRSFLELEDNRVTVDPAGEIVEPYGATRFGYFAFERLAALLPKGYRP